MTEADWLAATDPAPMLRGAARTAGDRKLRLYCPACCERVRRHITDDRSLAAVDFLARTADLPHNRRTGIAAVRKAALDAHNDACRLVIAARDPLQKATARVASNAADAGQAALGQDAAYAAAFAANAQAWVVQLARGPDGVAAFDRAAGDAVRWHQAGLLRDVVGNHFLPIDFDGRWRTPRVVGLAEAIDRDGAYDRLPILTDALEECGCDQPNLLAHLRSGGPHVRGTWSLDVVLGRA